MTKNTPHKSGFIGIIGLPNAGKSMLIIVILEQNSLLYLPNHRPRVIRLWEFIHRRCTICIYRYKRYPQAKENYIALW